MSASLLVALEPAMKALVIPTPQRVNVSLEVLPSSLQRKWHMIPRSMDLTKSGSDDALHGGTW